MPAWSFLLSPPCRRHAGIRAGRQRRRRRVSGTPSTDFQNRANTTTDKGADNDQRHQMGMAGQAGHSGREACSRRLANSTFQTPREDIAVVGVRALRGTACDMTPAELDAILDRLEKQGFHHARSRPTARTGQMAYRRVGA